MKIYPWDRYWCKRDGLLAINDNGFLFDPSNKYANFYNKDIFSYTDLSIQNCIVFLGEPSSGKTISLLEKFKIDNENKIGTKEKFLWIDLNQYSDENRLITDVFRNEAMRLWQKSAGTMNLFLDSFDEAIEHFPNIGHSIIQQLNSYGVSIKRLKIRFICRTGLWPEYLTVKLEKTFDASNCIFEITPLIKKDVESFCSGNDIEWKDFIEFIDNKKLHGFASHPITLEKLANKFRKEGALLNNYNLFYDLTKVLVSENNPSKAYRYARHNIANERKLVIASRIATIFSFCNHSTICTNISKSYNELLHYTEVLEGKEFTGKYDFDFQEKDVLETITNTALFSGRGSNKFGFMHQQYLEFLTAHYINIHSIPIQQLKPLLFIDNSNEFKVVPQLKNVSAWLKLSQSELISEVIKYDPKTLLTGDIDGLENRYIKDLVDSLLSQLDKTDIHDLNFGEHIHYKKLKHPEIGKQLKPVIKNRNRHYLTRRVAIDIVEACEITELTDDLVKIALNNKETDFMRDQASHAVKRIGDSSQKKKLLPLSINNEKYDSDDQIKGNALSALWPVLITTKEMFDRLSAPKRENLLGSYAVFIMTIPKFLTKEDLLIALDWVKKNLKEKKESYRRFSNLIEEILVKGWNNINDTKICNSYAQITVSRLNMYYDVLPNPTTGIEKQELLTPNEDTRKKFIKALVLRTKTYNRYSYVSLFQSKLISHNDFNWILSETISSKSKGEVWSELLFDVFDINNISQVDAIYNTKEKCIFLKKRFGKIYEAVPIVSEQANNLKRQWLESKKWQEDEAKRKKEEAKTLKPSVPERVDSCIERFEGGQLHAWYQLCMELTLKADSKYYGNELNSNLTSLPGWGLCSDYQHTKIVEIAKKYIKTQNSQSDKWFNSESTYYRPATSGYKAFILLKKMDPEFIETLDKGVFDKWVDILIAYPEDSGLSGQDTTFLSLIEDAFSKSPAKSTKAIIKKILIDNKKNHGIFILRKVENIINNHLTEELFKVISKPEIYPQNVHDIISYIYSNSYEKADTWTKQALDIDRLNEYDGIYGKLLMTFSDSDGFEIVEKAINKDSRWGKELFLKIPDAIQFYAKKNIVERFGIDNLANLYIWLCENFPKKEDPQIEGAHAVSDRESLGRFRDNLITIIKDSGKDGSILALERIQKHFPEQDYLKFYLVDAKEKMRINSWTPLSPEDLIQLISKRNSRIILNEEHLIQAITESLIRLERKLQGETPNAIFLWNNYSTNKYRPKIENEFTDFVITHLKADLEESGIVALREVEIHRKQSDDGIKGQLTDIYISGYIPSLEKSISVVIEVKGCWHQELKTAMKTQLKDRYLADKEIKYGIYLIGWFLCNHWDKKDIRNKQIFNSDIEEARTFFDSQASSISDSDNSISSVIINCALK